MTLAPLATEHGPRRWRCDGCGKWDYWSDEHWVYGSLRDEEEARWDLLVVTCSDACRARTEEAGRAAAKTEPVPAV